jgi:hypothetical protein
MRLTFSLLCSAIALSACSAVPLEAHYNQGSPETLLDLSVETVSVDLNAAGSIDQLVDWVNREQPSRAELQCELGNVACDRANDVFSQFSVPVEAIESPANQAVLVYERVVARDCDQRYIDNSINPYNLHYPTFGCSIAANMVQHVGDKRQFISPNLLDFHDAERLQIRYRDYATGKQENTQVSKGMESLLGGTSTSQ